MPTALGDTATVMGNTATGLTGETGSCVDFGGPVVVYEVTPSKNGTLEATITTSSMFTDLDFFARTTCADTATELDCENDGDTTTLTLAATAGTPIFLFVEADFVLTGGAFSLTTKLMPAGCGDGIVSGGEDCEPPNTTTCDATCHFKEVCGDGVDNDKNGAVDCEDAVCAANCGGVAGVCNNPAAFTSPATGATSGTTSNFAGTCTGSLSAEKVFTVTPPKPGLYTLTATPTGTADLGLYVRSDCADPTKELACANKNAGGVAETVTVPVDGVSPITLFVDGGKASEAGAFKLESSFQALTEVEPNETSASADAYAAPFIGNIDHAGDIDWISVNVATAGASITAVVDSGNGACVGGIDSQVEIYASDGTTVLGMNDDRATDKCSSLTVTAATAGTYFVKVRSSVANAPNATFVYGLSVSVM